jgi:hypothetical protein
MTRYITFNFIYIQTLRLIAVKCKAFHSEHWFL